MRGDTLDPLFRRVVAHFGSLTAITNAIGTLWMFAIMFMILADIFGRNIFNQPLAGVPELVAYSLVGAVFLQMANTLYSNRFVRAEPLIDALDRHRPAAASVFNLVFNLAGIAVFALIVGQLLPLFLEEYADPVTHSAGNEGVFTIANWPLSLVIVIGATLTGIVYAIESIKNAGALVRKFTRRRRTTAAAPVGWIPLILLAGLFLAVYAVTQMDLSKPEIGVISLIGMFILIFIGIHIALALITLSFAGVWLIFGSPDIGLSILKLASAEFLRNYFFGVVPLFVLMGLLVKQAGLAADGFQVAKWGLRGVKGGLGVATVAANAVFAAITGSSIASAAVFTKIATPELLKHGYTPRFSVGVVAGSSVLGMLIPPSLLLIVYGFIAEESVGVLFLAAIVPGIILATAMAIAIIGMAYFWPQYVGEPKDHEVPAESVGSASLKLAPVAALIVMVLGSIYTGIATPVEAGALGATGALLIALAMRRLTWRSLWEVLVETGHVSVAILFLILAANTYNRMLALTGLPQEIVLYISNFELGFFGFMMLYLLLVIFLGMFLESISLMLIVLPLVLPIVQSFGGDFVWFGIVTVIAVEMGLLTPPLGIACYVVRSTADDPRITLGQIFSGAFPFVVIMLLVTLLLIAVPEIVLFIL